MKSRLVKYGTLTIAIAALVLVKSVKSNSFDGSPVTNQGKNDVELVSTHSKTESTLTDNNEEPCTEALLFKENRGIDLVLVSTAQSVQNGHDVTFRMWYEEHSHGWFTYVERISSDGICGTAYTRGIEHLTTLIPLQAARELILGFYKKAQDTNGGAEAYREVIMNGFEISIEEDFTPEVTSVELWAMNQLGIYPPEGSYNLIDIDNEYRYEDQ